MTAVPPNIERYRDSKGEHRWRYRSRNGHDILADSSEGYKNRANMEAALEQIFHRPALDAALVILSLITGEEWDEEMLLARSEDMKAVAHQTLRKQGLSDTDAALFVDDRWRTYALPNESVATEAAAARVSSSPEVSATANIGSNAEPSVLTHEELRRRARTHMQKVRAEAPEDSGSPAEG